MMRVRILGREGTFLVMTYSDRLVEIHTKDGFERWPTWLVTRVGSGV